MVYLTDPAEIRSFFAQLAAVEVLWADTEVADWKTSKPRLSMIQVLTDPTDLTGNSAYLIDVLDKPDLVTEFIAKIMLNPKIEKVFHNASYDLRYLGKSDAQNVTCTYKMAMKIGCDRLGVPNLKLKTLAAYLGKFSNPDTEEQGSDWGQRPLTAKQLEYAKMDTVYLARVHRYLLDFAEPEGAADKKNAPILQPKKTASSSFTATKVRIAFECSRLFYLTHRFGGKSLFLPAETTKSIGIGSVFHKLADKLSTTAKQEPRFRALFEPPAEQLDAAAIASQMQQFFYELEFFPYLEASLQEDASRALALHQIWQGLIRLIHHWAELLVKNRRFCTAESVIGNTLLAGEITLTHNFDLPNGSQQPVIGKLDSLVFDFEQKRLCVVEYKTYQPADLSAQVAQVALYSYMLAKKKNVPVDSAVYCIFPEFQEYRYRWEELENTVHRLIPHKLQQMQEWLAWEKSQPDPPPPTPQLHLCEICPQQEKCQSFFQVAGEPSKTEARSGQDKPQKISNPEQKNNPKPKNDQPIVDADAIGNQLVETFQSFKIGVDYVGAAVAPAFIRVKLKPHLGVRTASLLRLSADLQVQMGIASPPLIAPQAGYVSVDLPRSDRQIAPFEDYIQQQESPPDAPVKIAIGVDLNSRLIEADLSDPNTCHFLVGGTTGSGKSEFLRSLLLSLLYRYSRDRLQIALVDPKRVTFPEFEKMPWLYSPVVKESDRAIELMSELCEEMESRYQKFESAACFDLATYNRKSANPLPRIVCIFDEYADFMAEKESREGLEQSIKRLGAKSRAAGIHLIIATQRPEAKVVTPLIRSNLPGRVALRTASEADSEIILGGKESSAAYLLGKGDLLLQVGSQLQRLQSLLARSISIV